MNGCFGTDYKIGDPCYASKRTSEKCLDMMEAAAYIGVGFDVTGEYTHAGRRKSLIQRLCKGKGSYQGEDVPDNMNVFGIYDTGCQGKSFNSMEERSAYQREESKLGNNEDFLRYRSSKDTSVNVNFWTTSIGHTHNSNQVKSTNSISSTEGRGSAEQQKSSDETMVFDFSCRVRRYEIFMDEVTPGQLSESFLQDYMNLPPTFFDYRNKAPQKYTRFLERWGTHYIKSASFGGKFTILREATKSGTETNQEWSAAMQESVTSMFESRRSQSNSDAGLGFIPGTAGIDVNSSDDQDQETDAESEEETQTGTTSERKRRQNTVDDLIVEGGSQEVAAILADKDRSGFKQEFKDWLTSVPEFPKGYDFKFGELSQLLDINFESLMGVDFKPCWVLSNGEDTYNVEVKDKDGNMKTEIRKCNFKSLDDFNQKMEKKRLSLKRAIQVYAKNKGRSGSEMVVAAGQPNCEQEPEEKETGQIPYETLLDGEDYLVEFDMLLPIGKKINQIAKMIISFEESETEGGNQDGATMGRWIVNNNGLQLSAGQLGPKVTIVKEEQKITLLGVVFTYQTDNKRNTLEWTEDDCKNNVANFKNLEGKKY